MSGKITGKVGDTFAAGRLGNYTVTKAADGGTEILLGPPFKFDKANIEEWKTVYYDHFPRHAAALEWAGRYALLFLSL